VNKSELIQKADKALDEIRPHLKVDGGGIEIVELSDDMILKVKWLGNCSSCSMSLMTMRAGVEEVLKQRTPEILSVEAVNGLTIDK
jgi:Fe-S cluster biogenesis protein NfuA